MYGFETWYTCVSGGKAVTYIGVLRIVYGVKDEGQGVPERKNYIIRSFVIYTVLCILVGGFSEREWIGGACCMNGVDVKCIYNFCPKV